MTPNPVHWHLLLNHIPILGTALFAPFVLAWGMARRSRDVIHTGFVLAAVLAVLTIPVYLSGEPAEEQVESASWYNAPRAEVHEERAEAALIVELVTGGLAILGLWLSRGGRPVRPATSWAVLFSLIVAAVLFGFTAAAGGQIRHDEIRSSQAAPS